ncbi:microsomal dipeptidase-like Zn-dependent dipeptidase [Naumannella cuiyingiana]|uniref:Microsomal dipeptidase-like Zn-dependent dipeptidase n=1 Tax=Naumannella cuiyingiana TaxID=1347891 RepID=A0A7Z0D8T2_9ACTN|nr:membrane dipeptidase [Naumannella cuiyingiana]NYI70884.1 microsomal dipeptidase-like Zn-dependent dipeptidase [Naumannella cuiyingiana]
MAKAGRRRRWVKGVLLGLLGLLLIIVAAFFVVAPGELENRMNRVEPAVLPAVSPQTQQLHDSLQVVDMHSDTLMWKRDLLTRSDRGHVDLPRLEEGNVAVQVFSSVSKASGSLNPDINTGEPDDITMLSVVQLQPPRTWNSLLQRSLYHGQKLERFAADSNGALRLIRTREDLDRLLADRAAGQQVTGAMFSVEGLQNLEGDIENFDKLYGAGMRMAGFTHFFDNEAAGSMHGVQKGGLTDLGRAAFLRAQQRGVIVDVTHSSSQTIDDMLGLATGPIVQSHGGVKATCENNRNLTDEQIRGIAETGGVIGIAYFDWAICQTTTKAVVDAIDHVVEVGGIGAAALGSDYDGSVTTGWDTAQLAAITQELVDRGYDDQEIAAIMGGNTIRVMRAVLPP